MAIKYAIDELLINEYKDKRRVLINGWCASEDGTIPSLRVFINNENIEYTVSYLNRYDAVKIMKLPSSAVRCGFMICIRNIPDEIKSIAVEARAKDTERKILDLKDEVISMYVDHNPIITKIDNVSYSKETSMINLNGWAISEVNGKISFGMCVNDGDVQPVTARNLSRDDLVQLGYVDKEKKYCGYMLSFPCKKKDKLKLVFSCEEGSVEIPVMIPKNHHLWATFKSLITNINPTTLKKATKYFKRYGFVQTLRRLRLGYMPSYKYDDWFKAHRVTNDQLKGQRSHKFAYEPKVSLLVPTFNTPLNLLAEMVDTVRNQSYSNWELCIADGSNPDHPARKAIQEYAAKDPRIKVTYLDQNYGISGNTNKAFELATGEYTAMYDHDDFLELNALYEVVNALNEGHYDIVYTDEDKFSMETMRFEDPNLKPDFSIDLLRSHNYITHLFVVKTEILREIGGFKQAYDGAQDYDVILRCIEKTDKIYHLPKVVYHWRMHEGSTAADPESKMYCYEAGRKAVQDHLARVGVEGQVSLLGKPYYGLNHVIYATPGDPLVSIVIPNYENMKVLKRCVDSLYHINEYKNFELIIVENNSKSHEIFQYYETLQKEHNNVKVVTWKGKEFNYSAINNFGVQYTKGKYLLLLNNDTEVIEKTAIREMLGCCMRDEVGIVGAKLLFEDDTVQHAGVVIGLGGSAGHVFSRIKKDDAGFMMRPMINCNYSAVTAACMMTKRELFDQVGGFDEELKVAFNDIDFCLKVRQLNKLVVYNAFALWHHYESLSRGYETSPEKIERFEKEIKRFQTKWHQILVDGDPYYNANFDVSYSPFELH